MRHIIVSRPVVRIFSWIVLGLGIISSNAWSGERLVALTTSNISANAYPVPVSEIEVVDLENLAHVKSFGIGRREVTSLAVADLNGDLFFTDRTSGWVEVLGLERGDVRARIRIHDPRDLALSSDQTLLFVSAHQNLLVVDARTFRILENHRMGTDTGLGLTLSQDGTKLAVSTWNDGAQKGTVRLYDVEVGAGKIVRSSALPILKSRGTVALVSTVGGCAASPSDVVFDSAGATVYAWDGICDVVFAIDWEAKLQRVSDLFKFERDMTCSYNYNNRMIYDPASDTLFGIQESVDGRTSHPAVHAIQLTERMIRSFDSWQGYPFALALDGQGRALVSVIRAQGPGGISDVLTRIDATGRPHAIYEFHWGQVRDMTVIGKK